MSEEFQNLIEKQNILHCQKSSKSNRKTKHTTLSEEFQNLIEKQNILHCQKSSKI